MYRNQLLRLIIAIVAVILLMRSAYAQRIITTIAGTDWAFRATAESALDSPLGTVQSVAVDSKGNVLLADSGNHMVFRITPGGTLTVVAGNGVAGLSGDGGDAMNASLNTPTAAVSDEYGNIYIADSVNSRVRRVSPDGTISTYAGSTAGIIQFGGDGGPATSAVLAQPVALAVDRSGNLYIADTGACSVVRRVDTAGIISTVAGVGGANGGCGGWAVDGHPATQTLLNFICDITVDGTGNLYILQQDFAQDWVKLGPLNYPKAVILKVTPDGIVHRALSAVTYGVSPSGASAMAESILPFGLAGFAVDSAGNLYIADASDPSDQMVFKVTADGRATRLTGTGNDSSSAAALRLSTRITLDSGGNVYFSGMQNQSLQKLAPDGSVTLIAGNNLFRTSKDGVKATSASLYSPSGVAVGPDGTVYIAESDGNRVRKLTPDGTITTVAGTGIGGYGGDNGPATLARLNSPYGLALDGEGNLYIAEWSGYRVRKVNQNGIITTIAGNGSPLPFQCFAFVPCSEHPGAEIGDGGAAVNAPLGGVTDVAVDSAGDVYIAATFIRRVAADGTITTVVGSGIGFGGDGGPATQALVDLPWGVARDQNGNTFVAEMNNGRIRKVDPSGLISTFGGNGTFQYSGDGGPATAAGLARVRGVRTDNAGNVYIVQDITNVVRIVTSDGTIQTLAGNGQSGYTGDGGPAFKASLGFAVATAIDVQGNIYIADQTNHRVREVLAAPPYFKELPLEMTFNASSGGKVAVSSLVLSATLNAQSNTAVPGMAYMAHVSSNASWLSLTPQNGSMPGLLTVTADPFNLAPGTYQGAITITVPNTRPSSQTVEVQFTVTSGVPPAISIDQKHLSFTYATTSAARSQTIVLSNSGGGSLNFNTSISLNSGQSGNWLSIAPQSGTATPGNPVSIAVRADPSNLPPGTYTGSVTIQGGSAGSVTLPVTMTITTNPYVLLLSQTGLTFTAVQNGGAIPPQTFGVVNLGSGTLGWTVQTSTLAGGNWLNATPGSGSSDAASPDGAPLVTVSVNPAGLQPGIYYGLVKVVSTGAANTPQEVVAVLRVLQPNTDLGAIVLPSSLIFTSPTGVSSPSSQNLLVYDPTGTNKSFRSAKATMNGGSWFVTLPGDATIAANQPTSIVVQPIVNGLGAGVYTGTLTLEFSDGRVTAVPITFVVTASGAGGSSSQAFTSRSFGRPADSGNQSCTPSKLVPALTTLSTGFNIPASFPQQLIAQIVDDCGTPLTQGKVSVEFSTGQPIQYMDSLSNGRWDLTWQTAAQATAGVTLTVRAEHPTLPIAGSIQITGGLGATQPRPKVFDNGVVSAASSLATPVAPGGIIAIYGSSLSDAAGAAPVLPLPTLFNNTTVTLGDYALPLFYTSDGLLNAVVPYEINTNTNMNLLVQRENSYADVVRLNVAAAQPEVFQYGQQRGIAVDGTGNLNGPSNPAHAGDVLVFYCAGLGAVNPPVADGAAAPLTGAASTTANQVTVTIGGQSANVGFAGLTAGLVGLYQINLTVPQGVTPGDQVPVIVSAAGQASSVVYFSVR